MGNLPQSEVVLFFCRPDVRLVFGQTGVQQKEAWEMRKGEGEGADCLFRWRESGETWDRERDQGRTG